MSHGRTQLDWLPAAQRCRSLREAMLPYPIPVKRASIGCSFHDNARQRQICDHHPEVGTDAVDADRALRSGTAVSAARSFCIAPARRLDEADPFEGC